MFLFFLFPIMIANCHWLSIMQVCFCFWSLQSSAAHVSVSSPSPLSSFFPLAPLWLQLGRWEFEAMAFAGTTQKCMAWDKTLCLVDELTVVYHKATSDAITAEFHYQSVLFPPSKRIFSRRKPHELIRCFSWFMSQVLQLFNVQMQNPAHINASDLNISQF